MAFLQKELFQTPEWLIDQDIFNKVEFDGNLERVRGFQERSMNNLLDFGRMARLMENSDINGNKAYSLLNMMTDLRTGIWIELNRGNSIDLYRRNLQRAYLQRMEYLMTEEQTPIPARFRNYVSRSNVDVANSDIRPIVRGELVTLQGNIRNAMNRSSDKLTRYHLQDAMKRIDLILNPIN